MSCYYCLFLIILLPLLCLVMHVFFQHYQHHAGYNNLPPGSMGWPYVGETLDLFSQNPNIFFKAKLSRYGEIFKTHILGRPSVMLGSPDAVKLVLMNQGGVFKPTFPARKEAMIGPQALFFHDGFYHVKIRRLIHSCLLPEAIRGSLPSIEAIALSTLRSFHGRTVNTYLQMKKYAFDVGIHMIFGPEGTKIINKDELESAYGVLEAGYNSMAINLPGTNFHRALQARKKLNDMITKAVEERRKELAKNGSSPQCKDLLGALVQCKESPTEKGLSDQQIVDNVIGVIFASRDTTASLLTWLLKFLKETPSVLHSVAAEHESIRKSKSDSINEALTWADTRAMRHSSQAIQETLRLASIISYTFRETTEDVEYKGYVIPKGWKVMPLFRSIHHNPDFFPEPLRFDPSRFQVPPKPNTFLPFGSGAHSCPGNELAKLEILIFLHLLMTKFRWDIVEKERGLQYSPFVVPKGGLPMRVTSIEAEWSKEEAQ